MRDIDFVESIKLLQFFSEEVVCHFLVAIYQSFLKKRSHLSLTRKPVNAVCAVLGISKAGYVRALRKRTILYIFVVNCSVPHCFIHFF